MREVTIRLDATTYLVFENKRCDDLTSSRHLVTPMCDLGASRILAVGLTVNTKKINEPRLAE